MLTDPSLVDLVQAAVVGRAQGPWFIGPEVLKGGKWTSSALLYTKLFMWENHKI